MEKIGISAANVFGNTKLLESGLNTLILPVHIFKIPNVDRRFAGHASGGFNEEVIWISIGMSIAIVILITIALCYLARQRCKKRQEISIRT